MNRSRALLPLGLVALATGLAACGDDDEVAKLSDPSATISTASAPKPEAGGDPKDLSKKPRVALPTRDLRKISSEDIVAGKGKTVKVGDNITVQYVGVLAKDGTQFDASWDNGAPADFQLAKGALIDGWVQGIPGMKEGGRRILRIPSDLAYGEQGGPDIPPNSDLVFVIDLKKIN